MARLVVDMIPCHRMRPFVDKTIDHELLTVPACYSVIVDNADAESFAAQSVSSQHTIPEVLQPFTGTLNDLNGHRERWRELLA